MYSYSTNSSSWNHSIGTFSCPCYNLTLRLTGHKVIRVSLDSFDYADPSQRLPGSSNMHSNWQSDPNSLASVSRQGLQVRPSNNDTVKQSSDNIKQSDTNELSSEELMETTDKLDDQCNIVHGVDLSSKCVIERDIIATQLDWKMSGFSREDLFSNTNNILQDDGSHESSTFSISPMAPQKKNDLDSSVDDALMNSGIPKGKVESMQLEDAKSSSENVNRSEGYLSPEVQNASSSFVSENDSLEVLSTHPGIVCITGRSFIGVESQIELLSHTSKIISQPVGHSNLSPQSYYIHTCLNCNLKCFLTADDGSHYAIKGSVINIPSKIEDPDYSPIFKVRIIPQASRDFSNHVVKQSFHRESIPKPCLDLQKEMQRRILKAKAEMEVRIERFSEIERRCFDRMMRRTCEIERKLIFSRIIQAHYDDSEPLENLYMDEITQTNNQLEAKTLKNNSEDKTSHTALQQVIEFNNTQQSSITSSSNVQIHAESPSAQNSPSKQTSNDDAGPNSHNSITDDSTLENMLKENISTSPPVRRRLVFDDSTSVTNSTEFEFQPGAVNHEHVSNENTPPEILQNHTSMSQTTPGVSLYSSRDEQAIANDFSNRTLHNATLFEMEDDTSNIDHLIDNESIDSDSNSDLSHDSQDYLNEQTDSWIELNTDRKEQNASNLQHSYQQSIHAASPLTKHQGIINKRKSNDATCVMGRSLPISIMTRPTKSTTSNYNDRYIFEQATASYIERYEDVRESFFQGSQNSGLEKAESTENAEESNISVGRINNDISSDTNDTTQPFDTQSQTSPHQQKNTSNWTLEHDSTKQDPTTLDDDDDNDEIIDYDSDNIVGALDEDLE